MPAFLRIFTRVNLLVMVGQEQGEILLSYLPCSLGLTLKPRRS